MECGEGKYYCNTDQKCKPIPKGYKVMHTGELVKEGSLHKWFSKSKSKDGKKGWVNVVTGGTCASDKPGEGTPKCVSSAKRASMTKAERLSAQRRKKKADPNQQSKSGAAKPTYVRTDSKKAVKEESVPRNSMGNPIRIKDKIKAAKGQIPHKVTEAKVDQGKDDAAKKNERNQRTFGNRRDSKGSMASHDDTEARRYNTAKGRGVKMKGKKDKTPVNYHKKDSDKRVDALLKSMKEEKYRDAALDAVKKSIIAKYGKGAIMKRGQPKKVKGAKSTVGTGKYKKMADDKKQLKKDAKEMGYGSDTKGYVETRARYGSKENMKKGRGLGT